jgi:hypothetical protein
MTQERLDFFFTHILGMMFDAEKTDIAHNPVAIGLFGTVSLMVVAQNLANLIHELQVGIRPEFWLVFHKKNL